MLGVDPDFQFICVHSRSSAASPFAFLRDPRVGLCAVSMLAALAALAAVARAEIPAESIPVYFRDSSFVVRDRNVAVLTCRREALTPTEKSNGPAGPEEELWKRIATASREYRKLCIRFEVADPKQVEFARLVTAIERVKQLAAAHAEADCKVEISVVPAKGLSKPDGPLTPNPSPARGEGSLRAGPKAKDGS
jgi:hypothetical protein